LLPDAGVLRFFFPAPRVSSSGARPFLLLFDSGRGGAKGVGDPVPAVALEPDDEPAPPRRPLAPPFRSLLCTDDRVSVKLLRSPPGFVIAAALPRFPRPFGILASRSLVGESQNLQTQIFLYNPIPTYMTEMHNQPSTPA